MRARSTAAAISFRAFRSITRSALSVSPVARPLRGADFRPSSNAIWRTTGPGTTILTPRPRPAVAVPPLRPPLYSRNLLGGDDRRALDDPPPGGARRRRPRRLVGPQQRFPGSTRGLAGARVQRLRMGQG